MGCTHFAVVGFWDFNSSEDKYECARFFIIPNPMCRNVQNKDITLQQILYTSEHTDDVFFFFKGYASKTSITHELQVAFLNLEITEKEKDALGDSRHILDNCKIRQTIPKESLLNKYITDLNYDEEAHV